MGRNVIVLMLDTARASDVYGNQRMVNINAIAKKGTVYLNTVAPGTWTAPTHASIFTDAKVSGIKQVSQNFFRRTGSIDPWMVKTKFLGQGSSTLAGRLSAYGYYSVLLSNNPFLTSYTNLANGFDKVYDIWKHSNVKYNKGLSQKVSFIFNGGAKTRANMYRVSDAITKMLPKQVLDRIYLDLRKKMDRSVAKADGTYRLDRGASDTNAALSNYLKYGYNYAPQFMFINYIEAHENYPLHSTETLQDKWLYLSGIETLDSGMKAALHAAYRKRLQYLDKKIGETLDIMRDGGLLDHSTVIITSDHGQLFGEHGGLYHAMPPYEGVSKVPLVAANYENGKLESRREVVESPVSLLSLHKAIVGIASGKYNELDGNMQRRGPILSEHAGISEGWDADLLARLRSRSATANKIYLAKRKFNRKVTAVYSGKYKLLHFFGSRKDELYDISADPGESVNLIDSTRPMALTMLHNAL